MAIPGIQQPEFLTVDERLRLRKFDGVFDFALAWYQDPETNYLVDGKRAAYDQERLSRMYHYLEQRGELYFIEVQEQGKYVPIGDVAFWQADMPIVIGNRDYRGQQIGRRVVSALVQRGRELGYDHLEVDEIYQWNEGSRRCFEIVGFRAYEKTEKGHRYRLML